MPSYLVNLRMPLSPGPVLLSVKEHLIMRGAKNGKLHHVMVTYGYAKDEQKRPIVSQMGLIKSFLDGTPSIELWVDSKLAGLCALEVSRDNPEDADPEDEAPGVHYRASVRAVVIRKSKRRMGFAHYLSTAAAGLFSSQIFSFMSEDGLKACTVAVQAVFLSKEGERFYFDMTDKVQNNFSVCEKILGKKVKMVFDAGS